MSSAQLNAGQDHGKAQVYSYSTALWYNYIEYNLIVHTYWLARPRRRTGSIQLRAQQTQRMIRPTTRLEKPKGRLKEARRKMLDFSNRSSNFLFFAFSLLQKCKFSNWPNFCFTFVTIVIQTGEQMAHMAQGAIDGMKNTLGMNDKKWEEGQFCHFHCLSFIWLYLVKLRIFVCNKSFIAIPLLYVLW